MSAPSPVTGSISLIVDSFDVDTIIKGYREDVNVDVSEYFKGMSVLPLYQCPDTGMRFFHPSSLAGDGNFYTELEDREGYYSEWKWEYEKSFPLIPENSTVLDIGCGRGAFLQKIKKEKNCIVHGLELNPSAYETLLQRGISAEMKTIEEKSQEVKDAYDVVTFFQVLEHIASVKSFLDAAIACLKPGGKLIVGVPNNDPYMFGMDKYHWLNLPPHHMGWWNKDSFRKLADFFPLEVVTIQTSDFRDYNNYLKGRELNLSIQSPEKLKWFRLLKPFEKQWIQITRNRIPGVFMMGVYTKKM